MKNTYLFLFTILLLLGCNSAPVKETQTLGSIDTKEAAKRFTLNKNTIQKQNEEKIKQAYYQYIKNAKKTDASRRNALTRLAQLELNFSQKLLSTGEEQPENTAQYNASLQKTAQLLETTLKDYPNAKGNDQNLYQLARTYSQLDKHALSEQTLRRLIKKYPKSNYFVEAQFRVAEHAFARGDYLDAEDAYTEVILSPIGDRFYEKALFKRGWTRYKQQLPEEALDDYIAVANTYKNVSGLSPSDKSALDETFRAIALSSSLLEPQSGLYEYLKTQPKFALTFESYRALSQIYLAQERYSDANTALKQFIKFYPNHQKLPYAYIEIIDNWKKSTFKASIIKDITQFYTQFNPDSSYWSKNQYTIPEKVHEALRSNLVLVAKSYHENYQKTKKQSDFKQAQIWYKRYLQHYPTHANKKKLYSTYGNLLESANQYAYALENYEKAAFNNNLILDKQSAYRAIQLANILFSKTANGPQKDAYLNKYLNYSKAFVSLYSSDKNSPSLVVRSAQLSFQKKRYSDAIEFTQMPIQLTKKHDFDLKNVRAQAFFEIKEYANAEQLLSVLLSTHTLSRKQKHTFNQSLALSIYKQGETANNNITAYEHFSRISNIVPQSDIAAIGLFDAISIAINEKKWKNVINDSERFKKLYPSHKKISAVNKSLTVAYLNSNQEGKAAIAFEQLALSDEDKSIKIAALWKAGELYENKKQYTQAIRAYRDIANKYPQPFDQNMEAMYKLVTLYGQTKDSQKRYFWQNKIRRKDLNTPDKLKSDRTQFIAATTMLDLAQQKKYEFERVKLIEPLNINLGKKKKLMQQAIKYYGRASSFGISDTTTEATHSIGMIYKHFSTSLLESQRPANLNEDELEQYEILLEDQAFPFEEKAIELFEVNVIRVKDQNYNKWIAQSFNELESLFPARYSRKGKIGLYDE